METWEFVMDAWASVMDCVNLDVFVECVKHFEAICSLWLVLFNYVNKTCIIPHKEKFVKA